MIASISVISWELPSFPVDFWLRRPRALLICETKTLDAHV